MAKGNGVIPNVHLRKNWKRWVRTYFDQPMAKKRRAAKRAEKAACSHVLPRPLAGSVRPIVRCSTNRNNHRERLGRGFSLEELAAAGINRRLAPTIGISVDHRRKNRNVEALQQNVQRLKEYKTKLILFPRKLKDPKKGDASAEEMEMPRQLSGVVMPIDKTVPALEVRVPTEDEKKFQAYITLRRQWRRAKLHGIREKKAREAAEAAK